MKNCRFCFKPVPNECYILIKGSLAGREFKVSDDVEFACEDCLTAADAMAEPDAFPVGDVVLVGCD